MSGCSDSVGTNGVCDDKGGPFTKRRVSHCVHLGIRDYRLPMWGDFNLRVTGPESVLDLNALDRGVTIFDHEAGGTTWRSDGENPNELMVGDFLQEAGNAADGYDGLWALEVVLAAYRSGRAMRPWPSGGQTVGKGGTGWSL